MFAKNKKTDLTTGPLGRQIILFALPLAAASILQQLFNAADTAIIGRFVGKTAMAAVGSSGPVLNFLINLFAGLSVGVNIMTAFYIGKKDSDKAEKSVGCAVFLSIVSGLILAIFGIMFSGNLLTALQVPADVYDGALLYLRIYLLGMPIILLYNFESAVFRSAGDTSTPLLVLLGAGFINVALNIIFIIVFHMTVDGVAWATVISNALSAAILFVLLLKRQDMIHLSIGRIRYYHDIVMEILKIGMPAGLQGIVFSLSNLLVQSAINSLGSDVMAACSASLTVENFAFFLVSAYGQTCTTFVSQNRGAGKTDRCNRALKLSLLQSLAIAGVVVIALCVFARTCLMLFTTDPEVLTLGAYRMRAVIPGELAMAIIETLSGYLRGMGRSLQPALISAVGIVGSRVAWVFLVFPIFGTFQILILIYTVGWTITAIAFIVYYNIFTRQSRRQEAAA